MNGKRNAAIFSCRELMSKLTHSNAGFVAAFRGSFDKTPLSIANLRRSESDDTRRNRRFRPHTSGAAISKTFDAAGQRNVASCVRGTTLRRAIVGTASESPRHGGQLPGEFVMGVSVAKCSCCFFDKIRKKASLAFIIRCSETEEKIALKRMERARLLTRFVSIGPTHATGEGKKGGQKKLGITVGRNGSIDFTCLSLMPGACYPQA